MTVRVARWSATHPWRAMALWVAFVVACIAVGSVVGTKEATDGINGGETEVAGRLIQSGQFPDSPTDERIVVTSTDGPLDLTTARTALEDVATKMRALPEVSEVQDPVPAQDGSAIMMAVIMSGDPDTSEERVQPLLDVTT